MSDVYNIFKEQFMNISLALFGVLIEALVSVALNGIKKLRTNVRKKDKINLSTRIASDYPLYVCYFMIVMLINSVIGIYSACFIVGNSARYSGLLI